MGANLATLVTMLLPAAAAEAALELACGLADGVEDCTGTGARGDAVAGVTGVLCSACTTFWNSPCSLKIMMQTISAISAAAGFLAPGIYPMSPTNKTAENHRTNGGSTVLLLARFPVNTSSYSCCPSAP